MNKGMARRILLGLLFGFGGFSVSIFWTFLYDNHIILSVIPMILTMAFLLGGSFFLDRYFVEKEDVEVPKGIDEKINKVIEKGEGCV